MSLWQGKRQEAKGKSKEVLGDFTFLYTVWFYCVHLLSSGRIMFRMKQPWLFSLFSLSHILLFLRFGITIGYSG
ncbi:MAG: hypothetical protein HEQ13_26725 [Dolichospermum sp. DEX189]|nr:hypothetical protein [Dolichospermum sp. DEX189]